MKIRCSDLAQVTFSQGDMTDVDIPEETYDAAIDKGLMDAIVCRAGGQKQVLKYVSELERITKDDGVFVIISRGLPEERLQYLEQFDIDEPGYTPWFVDVQAVRK